MTYSYYYDYCGNNQALHQCLKYMIIIENLKTIIRHTGNPYAHKSNCFPDRTHFPHTCLICAVINYTPIMLATTKCFPQLSDLPARISFFISQPLVTLVGDIFKWLICMSYQPELVSARLLCTLGERRKSGLCICTGSAQTFNLLIPLNQLWWSSKVTIMSHSLEPFIMKSTLSRNNGNSSNKYIKFSKIISYLYQPSALILKAYN